MKTKNPEMKLLEPFDIALQGINLVEASAGTGKTYNITSLYIRAIIEHEMPVSKILVVTYTDAATKELKDRLLGRIRESINVLKKGKSPDDNDQFLNNLMSHVNDRIKAVELLEQAVRSFDEAAVYTIHGFCYQALQEQAFDSRSMYDAEMIGDDSELVQEAVDDYWRKWTSEASEDPKKELLLKLFKDKSITPDSLANELSSYIGKPYLKVLPEEMDHAINDNKLDHFLDLHREMQQIWDENRAEIVKMLSRDEMKNYRSDWLAGWSQKMDAIYSTDTPTIQIFDKFERFTQSYIDDDGLKKGPKNKGVEPPRHTFFKLADEYKALAQGFQQFDVYFKKDLLGYLRKEMDRKKEDLQVLSYDDLLLRLQQALLNNQRGAVLAEKLRDKYPIAMVDEFQDTDPCQYDIFRSIYKDSDGALFMIGDPKQSIYSFRGADVYSYIQAREDAPPENRFRLDRNFRSVPELLTGLNTLWGDHDRPFLVDDIGYQRVEAGRDREEYDALREDGDRQPPIYIRHLSDPQDDPMKKSDAEELAAADTAQEINRLIEKGRSGNALIGEKKLRARDIAVLVRSHKQADMMSEALQEYSIKSVRHSHQSVFESEEAKHLGQLLRAVAEPGDETLIKTALSLPFTSHTASSLLAIEENEGEWTSIMQQFSEWNRRWREHGFAPMFRLMLADLEIPKHLIKYSDGERKLTNILHLGELLQREAQNHGKGDRALLHWLEKKRKDSQTGSSEEEQLRLESDEELVKIVTMHKSKGLQYPVVFCPFLWKGPHIQDKGQPLTYHKPGDSQTAYLDLSGKSGNNEKERAQKRFYAEREDLAESLRLAYVAMTRAQNRLYLSWAFAKESQLSAMGYLFQDPDVSEALLKSKVKLDNVPEWALEEYENRLEAFCEKNPDLFKLQFDREDTEKPEPGNGEDVEVLESVKFQRETPLAPSYSISSFSSLTTYMDTDPDMPDYDQFLEAEEDIGKPADELNMFNFPRGPEPGTCIHNIFEEIDFSETGQANELITEQFDYYGIDQKWLPTMKEMLETVTEKSLHPEWEGLTLSALEKKSIIPEMEFYYKNGEISTPDLRSIIRKDDSGYDSDSQQRAPEGFLKGFIDLTFEYNGKFYLLDYKSNYLGDAIADYDEKQMKEEMFEADYDLQYHIYTVALHRYLSSKMKNYSYDAHFGGAFYLFVRGINEEGREGIYFDRPEKNVIENLDRYILTGAHHA